MTAKEYLEQIRIINAKLKSMVRQAQALQEAIENIAPTFSDMPHSATRNVHKTEDIIVKKLDLENEIISETKKLTDISETVSTLSDTSRVVISDRYIGRLPWSEIAKELFISESRVYQLHREALDEIDVLLSKQTKDCS